MIITDDSRTQWVHVKLCRPTSDIYYIFSICGAAGHLFADDVKAFVVVPSIFHSLLVVSTGIQSLTDRLHS